MDTRGTWHENISSVPVERVRHPSNLAESRQTVVPFLQSYSRFLCVLKMPCESRGGSGGGTDDTEAETTAK